MGPGNPWSPDWRPDPTGGRAAAIRSSRRGALLAVLLLWPIALVATITSPGSSDTMVLRATLLAALAWPGLALLGAGLAPATLGSRVDAAAAGLALGIGAPIAAVLSTVIGVAVVVAFSGVSAQMGEAVGLTIRLGVLGAIRFAPLVALVVVAWVLLVRRAGTTATRGSGGAPGSA